MREGAGKTVPKTVPMYSTVDFAYPKDQSFSTGNVIDKARVGEPQRVARLSIDRVEHNPLFEFPFSSPTKRTLHF